MRAESEIQDRIRFLLTKELDRQVSEACARLPCNCKHHHKQPLDSRKNIAGEPNESYNCVSGTDSLIGLCLRDPEKKLDVCEDPIDAQRCDFFEWVITKEAISKEFNIQIKDLNWVSINLPEVCGLLWALGSETVPKLPWWKALWFRFIQIRPDPLVKRTSMEIAEGLKLKKINHADFLAEVMNELTELQITVTKEHNYFTPIGEVLKEAVFQLSKAIYYLKSE